MASRTESQRKRQAKAERTAGEVALAATAFSEATAAAAADSWSDVVATRLPSALAAVVRTWRVTVGLVRSPLPVPTWLRTVATACSNRIQ